MSDEYFTVDGTLIEAWVSHKSFQRKDGDETSRAAWEVTFVVRNGATTDTGPGSIRERACIKSWRGRKRSSAISGGFWWRIGTA